MRRFVIGDIHGGYKALMQCLERSNFDYENDLLISLGDIADGWSQVYECVEELLKIKNLIVIRGNHDDWFIRWLNKGSHPCDWLQGGYGTLRSYANNSVREVMISQRMGAYLTDLNFTDIPPTHITFWNNMKYYHVLDNKVFVHGGFDRNLPIDSQRVENLMWDRDLISQALSFEASLGSIAKEKGIKFKNADDFDEIFIGHTATNFWRDKDNNPILEPMKAANVYNLDTGGGWNGKTSIMDINTKEFWQSDIVTTLYDEKGRNG